MIYYIKFIQMVEFWYLREHFNKIGNSLMCIIQPLVIFRDHHVSAGENVNRR